MDTQTTRPLAVVTGASSGIGYELAKQFATNGFDLLVVSAGPTIDVAALDLQSSGANVESLQADLATFDGVEELYDKMRQDARPLDSVAINAGVGVSGDFARETALRDELNLI